MKPIPTGVYSLLSIFPDGETCDNCGKKFNLVCCDGVEIEHEDGERFDFCDDCMDEHFDSGMTYKEKREFIPAQQKFISQSDTSSKKKWNW